MNKRLCFVPVILMAACVTVLAQEPSTAPANPIALSERGFYAVVSGEVIAAAEKMPEESYSFKPTPDVRSFGQLVGHVADAQYGFCSMAIGEANPTKAIEKTKTSKADLVGALKDAGLLQQGVCRNDGRAGQPDGENDELQRGKAYCPFSQHSAHR
jgi:DinB superfamily